MIANATCAVVVVVSAIAAAAFVALSHYQIISNVSPFYLYLPPAALGGAALTWLLTVFCITLGNRQENPSF